MIHPTLAHLLIALAVIGLVGLCIPDPERHDDENPEVRGE